MSAPVNSIEQLSINTIRTLSIDAVEAANSGHPGLPMGAAPMAYVLWQRFLKHNPTNPKWPDRDRFVLSAGHGSALLYSLLHLAGYDLSMEDLRHFRQWGSRTPGHPEYHHVPGVEATTGPLGQGFSNAVGMAIAERAMAARFNRPGCELVDHFTYTLCSDGDLMEGVAAEAASVAGHLRLGRLIALFDSNDVSLDGPTKLSFTEDVGERFEAYGWHVQRVEDGNHDLASIDAALKAAREEKDRPSLIIVRTTIGFGAPKKAGTAQAHGSPLGKEELAGAKQSYGWTATEPFYVPAEVSAHFAESRARGATAEKAWEARLADYRRQFPEQAAEWDRVWAGELPAGWDAEVPVYKAGDSVETRTASGEVLNAIAKHVPNLIGTDADLSSSTKAIIKGGGDFDGQTGQGRNVRCGVREHAMGSIANGIAYHGGLRPFTSTFFVFSDYMRGAVRLAAMNGLPVTFVWTHDSVAVGEDGPTHQPIEQLMSLRLIPGLTVIRPADANETAAAWRLAASGQDRPVALVLTRQKLPVLAELVSGAAEGVRRGGYIAAEADGGRARAVLLATGSEVSVAMAARKQLQSSGIPTRVVSLPAWDRFEAQDPAYRDQVLGWEIPVRVSVEAGATLGWELYLGHRGVALGIDRFGASAPGEENLERFGFTADHVVETVRLLSSKIG